ncbi:MAG: Asp-tRNA(Asn)/Glu-tRNA(Gln) amidotransferase subunit GatA [Candidatus Bipolaricaulota bacterium]|nr:Asp-tRNA(Asn)/Glu-tRNA(Gln) amidotransferase subunit GatA [Candidatus Bipolaricaulota bacterium]MDW8126592.1 Asp-tRNA(Asn)/Glu-tRNA(Gln) amidotransferase subunit GatA [Candidatus Bipolaricaulota bacterium]
MWVQIPPPAHTLVWRDLYECRAALARGEITLIHVVDELYQNIEKKEPVVHAFLALAEREKLILGAKGKESTVFLGLPIAIKDNICTTEFPTTCGSRLLAHYRSPFAATAVVRLLAAGAQVQGKTNLDEFAMGSSTEHSAFGPTRNPWDWERVPGGSSGGSAAAVAAGEALAALGSDTGGSVRQPAALCGVVGLRPTYGLVSRYGLVAFASSLDTIGPITRSVRDAALILSVIAGPDPRDSTSLSSPAQNYLEGLRPNLSGLRLGLPREYVPVELGPVALALIRGWCDRAAELGAEVLEISLPLTEYALPAYYLIASAEAAANLARYDGVRYTLRAPAQTAMEMIAQSRTLGFGPEVKRRIALGTFALSAGYYDQYYGKAQRVRTLIAREFQAAFEKVDLIIGPTSPTPAFRIGEKVDPLSMYLSDLFTIPAALAGLPAISIPAGTVENLPFGLQLIGPRLSEKTLLSAAWAFEEALRA